MEPLVSSATMAVTGSVVLMLAAVVRVTMTLSEPATRSTLNSIPAAVSTASTASDELLLFDEEEEEAEETVRASIAALSA